MEFMMWRATHDGSTPVQVVDYGDRDVGGGVVVGKKMAISVVISNAVIMPNGIMSECIGNDGDWVDQDGQTKRSEQWRASLPQIDPGGAKIEAKPISQEENKPRNVSAIDKRGPRLNQNFYEESTYTVPHVYE
jgi:hypothetical protein